MSVNPSIHGAYPQMVIREPVPFSRSHESGETRVHPRHFASLSQGISTYVSLFSYLILCSDKNLKIALRVNWTV